MAFVQKVEKKSDLDDMMNEVQEKIQKVRTFSKIHAQTPITDQVNNGLVLYFF